MKKTLSLFLSLVMIAIVTVGLNITAQAESLPSTGKCGKSATYTFDESTGLLTIEGKGEVDSDAFSEQPKIKMVIIKNGITSLRPYTFNFCDSLKEVRLPASLKHVVGAFSCCKSLETIIVEKNNKNLYTKAGVLFGKYQKEDDYVIGTVLFNYPSKKDGTKYNVPSGVKYLAYGSFACTNLKEVTISKGVETIGEGAFFECKNLKKIFIPKSLKMICRGGFRKCEQLKNVYYEGSKKEWKNVQKSNNEQYFELYKTVIHYNCKRIPKSNNSPKIVSIVGLPKAFTVNWKKTSKAKGYQIQYSTDKKLKKNKKTITIKKAGTTSKYIKKLKSKKTYYVRIRSYKIKNNKKVYSAWSAKKKVKTK